MTTQPATYQPLQVLPAAQLNTSFDGKADLDPATGLLDVRELPAEVVTALVEAAAAVPASTVGQNGGPAGPLAGGVLPQAQLGLKPGTGITIAADGTIASTATGGGGGGGAAGAVAVPFAPPTVATFTSGWLGKDAHAVGLLTTSTATDDAKAGLRLLFAPCSQDQNQLRGLLVPAPAAPYELVAHVRMPSRYLVPYCGYGVGWVTSATRSCDVVTHGFSYNGSGPVVSFSRQAWTVTGPGDNACAGVNDAATPYLQANPVRDCYFRLVDDNTNRFFYIGTESANGPWHLLYSCPRAQDIGVPDTVGVFASVEQSGGLPPGIGMPLIVDNWTLRGLVDDPVY